MKRGLWTITLVLVFIGSNGWAGDGDLIVNGKLGLGTENPTGVFEIAGQVSVSSSDAIPTMTSNTTPSGRASADSEYASYYRLGRQWTILIIPMLRAGFLARRKHSLTGYNINSLPEK